MNLERVIFKAVLGYTVANAILDTLLGEKYEYQPSPGIRLGSQADIIFENIRIVSPPSRPVRRLLGEEEDAG